MKLRIVFEEEDIKYVQKLMNMFDVFQGGSDACHRVQKEMTEVRTYQMEKWRKECWRVK